MRKIATILSAVGIVAAGAVAAAPSASAADYTISACADTNFKFPVGSIVEFQAQGPCQLVVPIAAFTPDTAPSWVSSIDGSGHGSVTVTFTRESDWIAFRAVGDGWDVPYVGACGANEDLWSWDVVSYCGAGNGGGTPPPTWYQSYQRAGAGATCTDGWRPSWAQWANHGTGGYVCDREEYWDSAAGGWAFR